MNEAPEIGPIERGPRTGVPGGTGAVRPAARLDTPLSADETERYRAAAGEPGPVPARPAGEKPVPTAVIVEDDPHSRRRIQEQLGKMGFVIREAGDGESGLKDVATTPADLLVVDLRLPALDGFQVVRGVRSYLKNDYLKILVVSDLADPRDEAAALDLGADEYLMKPVSPERLRARVRNLFRRRRA